MAEESTTGSALYNVGTGVIGDFSVEARKNAMDRIKVEGAERKRKQQETEKKSEQAYLDLAKLQTGGWRHHDTYLKGDRDKISTYLEEGFKATNGNLFSGEGGKKKQLEYQNMLTDYNNKVAYSNQIKTQVENQQARLAEDPNKYTPESREQFDNYMKLTVYQQFAGDVPSLQLTKDPVDWETNLVGGLKPNVFVEKDYYAGKSGSGGNYKLKEDDLDAHVDRVVGVTFTEGAGNKYTDGFKKSITALYDNDPLTIANAPSRIVDPQTGSSPYLDGLKDFAKQELRSRISATQSSGEISRSYRAPSSGSKTDEDYVAPVRSGGGSQTITEIGLEGGSFTPTLTEKNYAYAEEGNIEFDSGDKAYRSLAAPVVINVSNGKVSKPSGNITLPKEGGVVQYGYTVADLPKTVQKALKSAGHEGSTVDMLRITKIEKETTDKKGAVTGGGETTTLIPITKGVDNSLSKASQGYNALKKAPAEEAEGTGELD